MSHVPHMLALSWVAEGLVWLSYGFAALTLGARSRKAMILALAAVSCFFLRFGASFLLGPLLNSQYLDIMSIAQTFRVAHPDALIAGSFPTLVAMSSALQYCLAIAAVFIDRDPTSAEVHHNTDDP